MDHVLLVEDDADIREALAAVLEEEGFSVATAPNGREALERLRDGQLPCAVVLDLMMPIMSGWEFRAVQLEDPVIAAIPLIVLTGLGDPMDRVRDLKANAYVKKPIDMDALVLALRAHC